MNLTEEVLQLMSPLSQDEGALKVEASALPDVLQPAPLLKKFESRRKTMRTVSNLTESIRVRWYKIREPIINIFDI
jgi:hypothetical protein